MPTNHLAYDKKDLRIIKIEEVKLIKSFFDKIFTFDIF